jgi:NADH-quinone oxidoreductase subunit L
VDRVLTFGHADQEVIPVPVMRWIDRRASRLLGAPHRHADGGDAGRRQHGVVPRACLFDRLHASRSGRPRFFAYLSLFTFAMLMLVTSDNLVQMFFGWEGVGLASYLLIGFWYKKPSANAAAMKAFIVNRVGDFGFALGIFGVFVLFGSVFDAIFAGAAARSMAAEAGRGETSSLPRLCISTRRTR